MFGKIVTVGAGVAAGLYGFSKLEGLDADSISAIGGKVASVVDSLADGASDMMAKDGPVRDVLDVLRSTEAGEKVFQSVSKYAGTGADKLSSGVEGFFDAMADAKAQAEAGDGTFLSNVVDAAKGEAVELGEQAVGKLAGAVASGADFLAELKGGMEAAPEEEAYEARQEYGDNEKGDEGMEM